MARREVPDGWAIRIKRLKLKEAKKALGIWWSEILDRAAERNLSEAVLTQVLMAIDDVIEDNE